MNTKVIYANKSENIDDAALEGAKLLLAGELVVFPTETVYGLGANALLESAVAKIFEAKGRPQDNPLIVHIAEKSQLGKLTNKISDAANALIEKFWPGPLSLIFESSGSVAENVTAGLGTVAVRMPKGRIAHALIKEAGIPVAAPSANLSGSISPTRAAHAYEDLCGKVPLIIDGGPCPVGVESTVVDMTKETPVILRPGNITLEMIRDTVGACIYHKSVELHGIGLKKGEVASPGMKYRHYSPKASLELFLGDKKEVEKCVKSMYDFNSEKGIKTIIICAKSALPVYAGREMISLGEGRRQAEENLFAALRQADELGAGQILFHADERMGKAVLNRIAKAASEKHWEE